MASYPKMSTPDGVWQVEVVSVRGRQSYRVRRLDNVMAPGSSGWQSTGQLVKTIDEVRAIMGDAFSELREVRDRRFDGGR